MTAQAIGWGLLVAGGGLIGYAFVGYPAVLWLWSRSMGGAGATGPAIDPDALPFVSVIVPVYNEAHQIQATLDTLLCLDYPRGSLQILVISDGSDDGTDALVAARAGEGVELLRVEGRAGKGAAENAAAHRVRGEVVVTMDASIRVQEDSLCELVRPFLDPEVGVVSGWDLSTGGGGDETNIGEAGYVGYEMWVRDLETRTGGIVGASGCFYAMRRELHGHVVPPELSRDFAAALIARDQGFRAVSAPGAVCFVPRTTSLRREYRRKIRTVSRGLATLASMAHLLDPVRFGSFSWKLFSHKVCRWLVPWGALAAVSGLLLLAGPQAWARVLLGLIAILVGLGVFGWFWRRGEALPTLVAIPAFFVMTNVALLRAWVMAFNGPTPSAWEPTRRTGS